MVMTMVVKSYFYKNKMKLWKFEIKSCFQKYTRIALKKCSDQKSTLKVYFIKKSHFQKSTWKVDLKKLTKSEWLREFFLQIRYFNICKIFNTF